MDILGIGFPELVFIFIIAIMIFGPRRLPEIAAKVGKTIADLRNMSQGLLAEWQREITVAARLDELEELKKAREELEEAKQAFKQSQKAVASEVALAEESIGTIAPPSHPSQSHSGSSPEIADSKNKQDQQHSAQETLPTEETARPVSGSSPTLESDASSQSESEDDNKDADQAQSDAAPEASTEGEAGAIRDVSSPTLAKTTDAEEEIEVTEPTDDPASDGERKSQTEKGSPANSSSLESVPTTLAS